MDYSQKRLLIVDDDDMLRDMHVMVFEDEGYQVDSAANGLQAWDLVNSNNYDLVATDLFMPEMNGIELTLKIQQAFPEIKIIMISGGGRELEATHKQQKVKLNEQVAEVDMFLKKPFDLDVLLSVTEKLLQDHVS